MNMITLILIILLIYLNTNTIETFIKRSDFEFMQTARRNVLNFFTLPDIHVSKTMQIANLNAKQIETENAIINGTINNITTNHIDTSKGDAPHITRKYVAKPTGKIKGHHSKKSIYKLLESWRNAPRCNDNDVMTGIELYKKNNRDFMFLPKCASLSHT